MELDQRIHHKPFSSITVTAKPQSAQVRSWIIAHDIGVHTQRMYVAGIPIAFIMFMFFTRIVSRLMVVGKILQSEFTV